MQPQNFIINYGKESKTGKPEATVDGACEIPPRPEIRELPQLLRFMKTELAYRIIELLKSKRDDDSARTIVMKIMEGYKDSEAETLVSELEEMSRYQDYLSEEEAMDIVSRFENYDGSRGPHWRDPDALYTTVDALGVKTCSEGHYNKWAFFAIMNMIWSDYWGVLKHYAQQSDEAKICAEMAAARLVDRDRSIPVRWYFGLD